MKKNMLDPFWGLGFEPIVNDTFPPYNVVQDNNDYYVEVALAGYNPKDINVEVENDILTISYSKNWDEVEEDKRKFLYKKIASRHFKLKLKLAQHMEVKEANSNNGILTVHVKDEVPQELLPKKFEVKMLEAIEK